MPDLTSAAGQFETRADDYDAWFDRHPLLFAAEVEALTDLLAPVRAREPRARGLEIGIGSGRFAEKLDITSGVDPSSPMVALARRRGREAVVGTAEALPFDDARFDFAAIITSLCFMQDPRAALREAQRVLVDDGILLLAYLDAAAPGARLLVEGSTSDSFYAGARLRTGTEVTTLLGDHGFLVEDSRQVVVDEDGTPTVRSGGGEGLFRAVRAIAQTGQPDRSTR